MEEEGIAGADEKEGIAGEIVGFLLVVVLSMDSVLDLSLHSSGMHLVPTVSPSADSFLVVALR